MTTILAMGLGLGGCEKDRLNEEVARLCAKDGGVKIFEVAQIPADRFDIQGNVRVPSKEQAKPGDEFYYERSTTYYKTGNPEMWRTLHRIVRRVDGKVLGESISYTRRGGDMPGPWHESAFICPPIESQAALEKSIFLRSGAK